MVIDGKAPEDWRTPKARAKPTRPAQTLGLELRPSSVVFPQANPWLLFIQNPATFCCDFLSMIYDSPPRVSMHFIRDIYAAKASAKQPVISFEFFPPKTDEGVRNLLDKHIPALCEARPDYCSVTYGAGGSTRDKTLAIVDAIQRLHGLTALAHLTCTGHTRDEVRGVLDKIRALGCKNILALR